MESVSRDSTTPSYKALTYYAGNNSHSKRIMLEEYFRPIRERGSILYLEMATEILNLPWLCITQIMAEEATNPKP